ncbi:MAG: hypothetical protein AB1625_04885 [Acidobacteriota bacterium]
MHRSVAVVGLIGCAAVAGAQSAYTPVGNSYGAEFAFALGRPIELRVEVEGVRFDTLAVIPSAGTEGDRPVSCEVVVDGNSVAPRRSTVAVVVLLEDENSRGLDRIAMEPFRVKSEKSFVERQAVEVPAPSLRAAQRAYVLLQIEK